MTSNEALSFVNLCFILHWGSLCEWFALVIPKQTFQGFYLKPESYSVREMVNCMPSDKADGDEGKPISPTENMMQNGRLDHQEAKFMQDKKQSPIFLLLCQLSDEKVQLTTRVLDENSLAIPILWAMSIISGLHN